MTATVQEFLLDIGLSDAKHVHSSVITPASNNITPFSKYASLHVHLCRFYMERACRGVAIREIKIEAVLHVVYDNVSR